MNPGDVAVFLCSDTDAFGAALDLLGLPIDGKPGGKPGCLCKRRI